MIDLREAQILERKIPQPLHGVLHRKLAAPELIQKLPDLVLVHKPFHSAAQPYRF